MSQENTKVGMVVKWLGNRYTIISKSSNGVLLKQNFSIGTVLKNEVPYSDISLAV